MIGNFDETATLKFYVELTEVTENLHDPWTETYYIPVTGPMDVDFETGDMKPLDHWLEDGVAKYIKEDGNGIKTCSYRLYVELDEDETKEQIDIQQGVVCLP